jgi:hypothetical protein
MPRKTKAQLNAEYEQIRLERIEEERAEYFPLLMKTLEDATTADFSMSVRGGKFAVRTNDWDSWKDAYHLSPEYSERSWQDLHVLIDEVNTKIFEMEETKRKEEVRRSALAKLTAEERQLLNL